jgi:hypothetical protein
MFTAYVRTKAGKITLCALPSKRRDAEEAAANMSKEPNVERVQRRHLGIWNAQNRIADKLRMRRLIWRSFQTK